MLRKWHMHQACGGKNLMYGKCPPSVSEAELSDVVLNWSGSLT